MVELTKHLMSVVKKYKSIEVHRYYITAVQQYKNTVPYLEKLLLQSTLENLTKVTKANVLTLVTYNSYFVSL